MNVKIYVHIEVYC